MTRDPEMLDQKASDDATPQLADFLSETPLGSSISDEKAPQDGSSSQGTIPRQLNNSIETRILDTQNLTDTAVADDDRPDLERVLTHLSISASPDGGYGWINVFLVFLINAHTWGLNSSYSIFLSHYLSSGTFPGATHLEYAFIGGLSIGCAYLVSPLVTLSIRKLGTGTTLAIGACLEAGSLIAASFAREIWQLALSQGACFGVGMGFLFIASAGIVSQWFSTKRSLANGIATAGSGIGGLIYSLATSAMIRNISTQWAFRVLGILAFVVNIFCALLIRDRYAVIGRPKSRLDPHLFKRLEFCLLLGFAAFSMLGYIVLLFSLASYARALGLSANKGATIAALMNLGQALGRPGVGYFSDHTGRINMAGSASFLAALFVLVVWSNAHSYGVLVFFALIVGTVAGTFYATITPLSAEVVGMKRVGGVLGWVWLVLVLPWGSYLGAILFSGFMYVGAALCLVLLRGWKIGEVDLVNDAMGMDVPAVMADVVGEKGVVQEARKEGWHLLVRNSTRWQKV
ncbi:major facilitator superfamily domain-containing protein [Delphinella strobiligena]|nr:major facilitator superfamily domain-containing protein [Delphinella strobiligena]